MKIVRLFLGSALLIAVACIVFLQPGDSTAALRGAMRSPDGGQQPSAESYGEVIVSDPVYPVLTAAARDLPPVVIEPTLDREINPRIDYSGQTAKDVIIPGSRDPLLDVQLNAPPPSAQGFDTPIHNFEGQGYTFLNPPDTVGDIGTNHYVQMINATLVAIYDKTTGTMTDQFDLTQLGGCSTGSGDPIVLYDQLADRWLLSEFGPGSSLCVFISQTPDPSGAYYSYQFNTPSFPDYPKYGVWTDAYYVTTNENNPAAYALDRDNMLAGNAATSQRFTAPGLPGFGFEAMTPADLDGATPPPAGAPGYIMRHRDTEANGNCANTGTQDCLEIFAFDVDWNNPGNSTFTKLPDIPVAEFDSNLCGLTSFSAIAMPGVPKCASNSLDPLREVVMFRLAYRNFGDHETLVGNLVTDASGNDDAGVRWFELRQTAVAGWSVFQEGTYAPDSNSRWMGAIAMDGAGNIALGYNVSSGSTFPSLRYAGRLASDPLGTLPQGEYTLVSGSASNGSNRYGDYAAMSIDPVDDCTFWFTGEYNPASQWSTRIGAFRFDECGSPDYTMSTSPASQDICEPDDAIYTVSTGSISGYNTPINLSTVGNPGTESFVPNPVTPGNDSTLTISGATAGNYTFDVVGDSGGNMKTNTVSLNVFDGVPAAPTLVSPADGAVDVPVLPTFTWNAVADATDYTIEIADDAGFTNIIDSATVAGTSYTPGAPLDILTTYWWRVTANNICGVGATSAEWSFTTLEGETISCNGPAVGFELGLPDSWVVDTPFGPVYWSTTDDLAACDNGGNQTPGSGAAACADADQTNQAGDPYDTSLVTNSFDLTGYSTVSLDFAAAFQIYINPDDYFAVEISTDNGATWTQELLWDTNHNNGGENVSLDLSAYAGNADVQARFRYYGEGWNWWAQVDDVALTCEAGGGDPIINVNPGSLAATQPPDTTTMQDLDISNVGGADLDWSIYEDASVMRPVSAGREIATVGANGVAGLAAAGTGTGVRATPESQANRDLVTITHSATNNIVQFNSVSCNAGGLHTDNSYLRVFDLDSFGITDNFDVTEVEIGIEQALGATGSQPISVNLYTLTDPNAPLTFGNLTPIGSTDTTVSDQSLTLWTASVTGTAPAGSVLVVEIFTPDGQTTGNSFFIGSNPDGQTGPSYLAAAACGVPEPLPTGDLGFPGMHIVMNVTGDTTMGGGQACDAPEDIGWASVAPDMGTTPPASTDTVSVTFDSTGLADGTYEGALCVESNDPVTPLVEVPVSLTVETPVGADLVCNNDPIAFESGLPASWSVDTPFGTVYWSTTDDLAACDNGGNQTLGSGEAACADSDETNIAGDPYDTSLVTNAIDLSGYNSVSLDFAVNYNDIDASGGDMFSVEVSTDGGATWTSELSWNSDHNEIASVDLSSYGGNANVLVRFRYAGLGWDWWAQVDDVSLACADAGVGPIIEVDPDTVHSSQQTNTTNDETFNINNLGDADLDWNIYEDAAFPAIPASDGNFPRGPYAASAGAPPAAANAPVSKGPGLNALLGSMAYGTETQTNNFDGFDLDVPEVLTPVAPYVWTTFPGAGAMDDGTDNVYFFDGQVAYEANVMTGVITPLGPVAGFAQDPSGMSQDPNTGVFYVVTTNVSTSILYTVDFGSLTATPVGTVTNAPAAIALAFTDAGDLYTYDIVNDVLLSVNPATGAGTVIGSIGFDANFGQGMDYDSASGTMYMAAFNSGTFQAELRSVNLGNGNTQFEGILGSAVPGGLTQLSFLAIEGGTPPPPEVCDVASDISWASVAPDMGTTPAMGSDTVTVTFDSTGLLPGEYEGTLCVESNDPNNPLVTVLLQLWVEEPPTAVEMADLSATVNADGSVTVAWETAAEVANAGFNVYRSVSADALGEMVNGALIASTASAGAGASYSFTDSAVGAGIFYYWVEAVATDGTTFAHGPVEAVTQAPTSAGLSGFGGGSSTALPLVLVAVLAVALLGAAFVSRRKA